MAKKQRSNTCEVESFLQPQELVFQLEYNICKLKQCITEAKQKKQPQKRGLETALLLSKIMTNDDEKNEITEYLSLGRIIWDQTI